MAGFHRCLRVLTFLMFIYLFLLEIGPGLWPQNYTNNFITLLTKFEMYLLVKLYSHFIFSTYITLERPVLTHMSVQVSVLTHIAHTCTQVHFMGIYIYGFILIFGPTYTCGKFLPQTIPSVHLT